jgi:hypothetical protein
MSTYIALNLSPRTAPRRAPKGPARKLVRARALPARRLVVLPRIPFGPSAGARMETVLMAITFMGLAGLAVIMEAVGTSLFY